MPTTTKTSLTATLTPKATPHAKLNDTTIWGYNDIFPGPTIKARRIGRIIRAALAVLVGVLWYSGQIGGTAATVLGILAIVFLLTSLISFCPLYVPFRISTRGK